MKCFTLIAWTNRGEFRVDNGNIVGGEWVNVGRRNIFVGGGYYLKKVIGNLA